MSSAAKSKSKDKRTARETPTASSKSSNNANTGGGISTSGYNPLSGTVHTLDLAPVSSGAPLHASGHFRNIDGTDDHSGNSFGTVAEYDSVSNNGSWSGESEEHKEKTSLLPPRQDAVPSADNDKREKIRQKNEKKHQRQKERRAQELHEKCNGYLMSRKLETLAQQLVAMGFPLERATMALILNEGRVEESVAWLFEEGEEADKHKEHNLDGRGNLKIDISDELVCIADMEVRYKCSKQEVERALVACEGDFVKAKETLSQKQEPLVPPKPEETGDPPTMSSSKLQIAASQNLIGAPTKLTSSTTLQQKKDEKESNYSKVTATVSSYIDTGNKIPQSLKRVQPKMVSTKPPPVAVPADKRSPGPGSNPSAYYSLASSSQALSQPVKIEARYVVVRNELKNLQLGRLREHVIMMQRRQSTSAQQIPTPSASSSSSPLGSAISWYPNSVEPANPNGLMPHVPGARNQNSDSVSKNKLYNQLHYQQQHPQQFVSNSGLLESQGTSEGNNLWNTTNPQPHSLAAASSLGLYSGLGTNAPSGSLSSVDWKTDRSMPQFHYSNIDWSLDRGSPPSISGGIWSTMNFFMQSNPLTCDSFTSGLGARAAMGPVLSNRGGVSIQRVQDGVAATETPAGVSREWASPFEESDLFSFPRHFVSSPSL